jgi:hypothetical protein
MRTLLVCGTLWLAGCVEDGPLSTDPNVAARQTHQLIPKGTPESRAKRVLGSKGFTLSRLNSDSKVNHLLVATCTRPDHTWLVGVVFIDGRSVACSVAVTEGQSADKR